jgi:hypothetical protein
MYYMKKILDSVIKEFLEPALPFYTRSLDIVVDMLAAVVGKEARSSADDSIKPCETIPVDSGPEFSTSQRHGHRLHAPQASTTVRWLNGRASDHESGGSRFETGWIDDTNNR